MQIIKKATSAFALVLVFAYLAYTFYTVDTHFAKHISLAQIIGD